MIEKEVEVDKIKIPDDRIRTSQEKQKDFDNLMDSIKKLGLFNPILINQDNELIAGYRRLNAFKELKKQNPRKYGKISVRMVTYEERTKELEAELHENTRRKQLKGYEVSKALAELKKLYEKQHPKTKHGADSIPTERDIDGKLKPKRIESEVVNLTTQDSDTKEESDKEEPKVERFTKKISKDLGVSERTIQRRTRIGEAIEEGEFPIRMVEKYKDGEVTETQMLKYLRKPKVKKRKVKDVKRPEPEPPKEGEEVTVKKISRGEKYQQMMKERIDNLKNLEIDSPVVEKMEKSFEIERNKERPEVKPKPKPEPEPSQYEVELSVDDKVRQKHGGMDIDQVREYVKKLLLEDKFWNEIEEPKSLKLEFRA